MQSIMNLCIMSLHMWRFRYLMVFVHIRSDHEDQLPLCWSFRYPSPAPEPSDTGLSVTIAHQKKREAKRLRSFLVREVLHLMRQGVRDVAVEDTARIHLSYMEDHPIPSDYIVKYNLHQVQRCPEGKPACTLLHVIDVEGTNGIHTDHTS